VTWKKVEKALSQKWSEKKVHLLRHWERKGLSAGSVGELVVQGDRGESRILRKGVLRLS